MNYYNFVNTILETAKSHKLVYEVGEGDIYEHLNSGDHKYPCVFLTVQNVDSNGSQMTVTGSLFYVDALLSDTSNKLQIQSTGMTTLQQIFMRLMDNYPDFDLRTGRYTPFDEKFADLCAGVFSNFTVSFMDDICIVNDDIFEGDVPPIPEPTGRYLTITCDDEGAGSTTISPTVKGSLPNLNLQYRINNGDWMDFIVGTTTDIHLTAGNFVQFKGLNPEGISNYTKYPANYLNFSISGNPVSLSGNVMSLIDGVGDTLKIPNEYCFYYLFYNSSSIKTVSSNFLPATELKDYCYQYMFYRCTALTTAPELPATTLANKCYLSMFYGCTSLKNAPVLPATTLADSCYEGMFNGCTSLVKAPVLPATTLAYSCYNSMFSGCTSLVKAPELPATTLANYCYQSMFQICKSLNYIKSLATDITATNALKDWLAGVAATGTFVKPAGVSYVTGESGIPEGWTVEEI